MGKQMITQSHPSSRKKEPKLKTQAWPIRPQPKEKIDANPS